MIEIRGNLMKFLLGALFVTQISITPQLAYSQAYSYESSPYNYKNSEYNYDNSQYNYKNSPYNYNNSQYNTQSNNGVYDNSGNRIGYETKSPTGVTNIYDNSGNRIGYKPKGQ